MKKLFILLSVVCSGKLAAQNVGIGTTTPQATLDIKGNQRIGGLSSYIKYDSATGKIEWTNANLYVPVTQALMKHSAAADGLFYNNTAPVSGQLEYRNAAGEPVFYTNFTNGNGYFKNFLGIGTPSPFTNLQIESNNSNPVVVNGTSGLYLSWAEGGSYRGYLGSYAGNPEDVDFGTYGGSTGKIHFTTFNIPRMTINSPGNVGIGVTDPTNPLSFQAILSKKISLYPGASGDVGMGVAGNLFKIYADHPNADVAFGYDDYVNGFIERMRVRGNGNVGIGTIPVSEKLEVAGNAKADNFIYTAPKTFYHSIHPSAFRPMTNTHDINSDRFETYYNTTTVWGLLVAPLYLPHGATVTSVSVYFYDNSASADLYVHFSYKAVGSTTFNLLAALDNTGTPGNSSLTTSSISSPLINNQLYSYCIVAGSQMNPFAVNWPGANLKIRDIVITYTKSNAE